MSVVQRILKVTPKQYHSMFGESFAAIAPLAAVIGVASTILVTYSTRTLLTHPDVYLSHRKRGSVVHDASDGVYRSHWVKDASAKTAGADLDEYHTNVFTAVNKSVLGTRPRLDLEKLEKL